MIKKYIQFIKENYKPKSLDFEYTLNEYDIKELFLPLIDYGVKIKIEKGFVASHDYFKLRYLIDKVTTGEITLGYSISIDHNNKFSDEQIEDILFAVNTLRDILKKPTISVHKYISTKEIIKGDVSQEIIESSLKEHLNSDNIKLLIDDPSYIKLTGVDVCNFYNWTYQNSDKDGNVYIHVSIDDLASNFITNRNDYYYNVLVDGDEVMYDNYDYSLFRDYQDGLLDYTLYDENKKLLIYITIDEIGWENIKDLEIIENYSEEVNLNDKESFVESVIDNNSFLEDFLDQDLFGEVKDIVADWEMNAKISEDYKTIVNDFNERLENVFNFEIYDKEVKKDNYTVTKKYYKILFEIIYDDIDVDLEDLKEFKAVEDFFYELIATANDAFEMNPYYSDYVDVNTEEMNKQITSYLKSILNKNV